MLNLTFIIQIPDNWPSLDVMKMLLDFLKDQQQTQAQIDALAETLAQGTNGLRQSTEGLKAAVTNNQE